MSGRQFRSSRPSSLLGQQWVVPGIGRVKLRSPGTSLLCDVDRDWPARRKGADNAGAWSWVKIMRGAIDRFAVVSEESGPLALWASKKSRVQLPDGAFYRLDYLEVEPDHRKSHLGLFAIALVAARAVETGAEGIVLGAIPNVVSFYEMIGFQRRSAKGWSVESGLVAYELKGERLESTAAYTDAFRDEG